jgi:branched-chain amino acid transport system permease protein
MQVFLQTLVGGLSWGAVYALVAMGFSLVYRTMGLINFAHGNVLMIGAYIASTAYLTNHLPFALAMAYAVGVTAILALVIERVLRPLETKDVDLMLIGTIGFGTVLEALAVLQWGATGHSVPALAGEPFEIGGVYVRQIDVVVILVGVMAAIVVWLFLQRTKAGAAMQAVAMDYEAATAVGVHVGRSNAIAFAIGGALAALAGALAGPMSYVEPTLGDQVGIQGFAAAILGGFGRIPGAIVGGLVFGLIKSFSEAHFAGYSILVTFVVFAVAIMVRPTGIVGEAAVNRA